MQFPAEPKKINRVVIYTLDSDKYPASKYGIKEGLLQAWLLGGWVTIAEVNNGMVEYPAKSTRYPAGGKIVFKFDFITTEKIRFIVLRSNDYKVVRTGFGGKREESVARIVEIEATGL